LQQAYDDLQHERMQALGQMAGGIAHDINNALSPAALYSQSLLEHDATLSAETRHDLTAILRSIESATDAVARMRELYSEHQPSGEHRPVDLNLTHGTWKACATYWASRLY